MQHAEFDGTSFLADRSLGKVTAITSAFAIGGSLLMLAEVFLPGGMPMLWGLWIPLCFLLIPSVHSLARENRQLRKRLDAIERTLAATSADRV
jgi:hypothetical protein